MAERINPYRLFVGAFIPNWLLQRQDMSHGAKLCYSRLAQYAGEKGVAFPAQATLADELGVSSRQIRNYLHELEAHHLIESEQRGLSATNLYYFLWHQWMEEPFLSGKKLPVKAEENFLSERKETSGQCGKILPVSAEESFLQRESLEENHNTEENITTLPPVFPLTGAKRRSRFFPDDFPKQAPDEFLTWAAKDAPQTDVAAEWPCMLDHEFDKPHSDWWRVARSWMRNAPKFQGPKKSSRSRSTGLVL